MRIAKEGKAAVLVYSGKISKKLPVFYNPVMQLNRDLSVLLLAVLPLSRMRIADPLAGSGIRSIRFLKELDKNKVAQIYINDLKDNFLKNVKANMKLNKIPLTKRIQISNEDASLFLLKNRGFDYIDIDPFGSPIPFLDAAVKKINKNGILAVTATDTSALCGSYENVCLRKYWAKPLNNHLMHEIGLRILIRKVQLMAAQYDKALTPVLSYAREHYMRVFFRVVKGKKQVDDVLALHHFFDSAGPVWTGPLADIQLLDAMIKHSAGEERANFLRILKNEELVGCIGFYDLHALAEEYKIRELMKKRDLIFSLKQKGYKAAETHFSGSGIKSNINLMDLLKILRNNTKNKKNKIKLNFLGLPKPL